MKSCHITQAPQIPIPTGILGSARVALSYNFMFNSHTLGAGTAAANFALLLSSASSGILDDTRYSILDS